MSRPNQRWRLFPSSFSPSHQSLLSHDVHWAIMGKGSNYSSSSSSSNHCNNRLARSNCGASSSSSSSSRMKKRDPGTDLMLALGFSAPRYGNFSGYVTCNFIASLERNVLLIEFHRNTCKFPAVIPFGFRFFKRSLSFFFFFFCLKWENGGNKRTRKIRGSHRRSFNLEPWGWCCSDPIFFLVIVCGRGQLQQLDWADSSQSELLNGCDTSSMMEVEESDNSATFYVKVYMDGIPIGRKLDLLAHDGYLALINTLNCMFDTAIICKLFCFCWVRFSAQT